ncbi:MAG: hypothetical protein KDD40_08205 [Bdellovibrionales bacterium]|nr:hypothetical protein [Bdellovibrionales bacterium]
MYIMWQGFDAKVSVVFVFCLIFAEAFVKLRWRLSIVCPHCGFDPVIYTKNPDVACQKVKKRLADRRESGDYLLSSNDPFRNLPKLKSPPAADPPRLSKHI